MWAEETKDGKTKFREQYKDPLTGKYREVSVTYDKNTNQTRRKAQIALERKIEYKLQHIQDGTIKQDVTLGGRVMKLTEKQKNCPYCHPGSKVNGRECWYHTTLALGEAIDSCTYTELYFDPVNRFLEASCEDELFIDINYCPMCGRPLNEEEE